MDIAACSLLSAGFIATFFAWPKERAFALLCIRDLKKASCDGPHLVHRDDPHILKRRLVSFIGFTSFSVVLLEYLLRSESSMPFRGSAIISCLFFPESTLTKSLAVIATSGMATLTLFSGPIFEGCRLWDTFTESPILILRNIVICPFGEELFFRALLLQILRRRSNGSAVLISSLIFAMSHSHHIFQIVVEEYRTASETAEEREKIRSSWKRAAMRLLPLYGCTIAYGLLSGYYYTKICQRNVLATTLTHSLCNMIGAPPFYFLGSRCFAVKFFHAAVYAAGIAGWMFMVSKLRLMEK